MEKNVDSLNANEILELVFAYLAEISSLQNYEETLGLLAKMGSALANARHCSIWILSDDKKSVWTKAFQGVDATMLPIDSGIVGRAIAAKENILIDDVYEDHRFNEEIDNVGSYKIKSMMVIPMRDCNDSIIGAFQVINHQGESDLFDQRDMERLTLASEYAAETLIRVKMTQEMKNHVKRVAELAKHFDPMLVDLFFTNLDAILEARAELQDAYLARNENLNDERSVKVLGAYGTRSKGHATSCAYLNKKNVIDAGNLLTPLDAECIGVENIWITHSHLDHIVDIASVIDNYFALRDKPLNLLGLPQTLKAIQKHFLNNEIWPDFSKIQLSKSKEMAITYTEIELDKEYNLSENETIRAIKTDHTVESCGYIYTKNKHSMLMTQDTYSLENIITELNENSAIKAVAIECSFPDEMQELAIASKHLTPKLLFNQLKSLHRNDIKIYINHIKPSYLSKITDQIEENRGNLEVIILKDGDIINF